MRKDLVTLVLLALQLVVCGGWATSQARADEPAPRFVVTPHRVLHDREVSIQLHDLKPNQRVTVRATRGTYKSEMEFVADAKGTVDVGKSDPKFGERVAPLQILWSMKREEKVKDEAPPQDELAPVKVSLSALVDGKPVAAGSFSLSSSPRTWNAPGSA